ncbi:MAG: DUF1553 domain-containing protein [Pirellulales bacterium]
MMKPCSIVTVVFLAVAGRSFAVSAEAPAPEARAPDAQPAETVTPEAAEATESRTALEMATSVFESPVKPKPAGRLDEIVFARLASLNIQPVLSSDAAFVRRVYLDVIGTLPTAEEARRFIEDQGANKRRLLIDRLLERDEFADYWAMRWGDVLRIKAEFPVNLWPNAAQAYHRWVRASIAANKPYDQFARELLTSSGSNFRVGPVNFYRAVQNRTPEGIAGAVALTFMGSRVDSWPKERLQGMAVFFSQIGYKPTREWKEEHVIWDPYHFAAPPANVAAEKKPEPDAKAAPAEPPVPVLGPPQTAVLPDGTKIEVSSNRDPRELFADWLIKPENPWFTRCVANRVWFWLMGRGIIHEPDDIRDDNPPSNPELLAYLEKELVASHYDLKALYRLILNSSTYQMSSLPLGDAKAEANFARYPLRRLDAEVLIDAINKVTGATDLYTSPIPEPFTYIPRDKPAIAIADGSISSPFLTLFGRSARATGMENERVSKPDAAQALHMLNSSHIQMKLEQGPNLKAILDSRRPPDQLVEELYLTILSRFPTADEIQRVESYSKSASPAAKPAKPAASKGPNGKGPNGKRPNAAGKNAKAARPGASAARTDWIDIAWALINSDEFLYRH